MTKTGKKVEPTGGEVWPSDGSFFSMKQDAKSSAKQRGREVCCWQREFQRELRSERGGQRGSLEIATGKKLLLEDTVKAAVPSGDSRPGFH